MASQMSLLSSSTLSLSTKMREQTFGLSYMNMKNFYYLIFLNFGKEVRLILSLVGMFQTLISPTSVDELKTSLVINLFVHCLPMAWFIPMRRRTVMMMLI